MEENPIKISKRGIDPQDERWFSENAIVNLKKAQEEIVWLLNRGYKINQIIEMAGNHYQFSARQRLALKRTSSSTEQCKKRKLSNLSLKAAKDGILYIDGFNLIITLEVALSKGVLLLGNDDTLRDLAGLSGTYGVIDKTEIALELIAKTFKELEVPEVKFYLDAPVSNSGRLKGRILNHLEAYNINVSVDLIPNVDSVLSKLERIVTSDSAILDACTSWFNLSRKIVEDYISDAWIVQL